MKSIGWLWLVLLGMVGPIAALAQKTPSGFSENHQQAIQRHLQQHPSLRDRRFTLQLKPVAPALPPCAQDLGVQVLGKDRAWGPVTLRLACQAPGQGWVRSVAAQVQVLGRMAIARHPLRPGDTIGEADIEWQTGDVTRWSEGLVEESASLGGMALVRPVNTGTPIRLNDLRPIAVIRAGDFVNIGIQGRGFEIVTSGHALADAALGSSVRVKTLDGKVLQGKAVSAGKIETSLD